MTAYGHKYKFWNAPSARTSYLPSVVFPLAPRTCLATGFSNFSVPGVSFPMWSGPQVQPESWL